MRRVRKDDPGRRNGIVSREAWRGEVQVSSVEDKCLGSGSNPSLARRCYVTTCKWRERP